ncbi:hypothetical protein BG003_007239 [Podila horticola]|nr:hypothetical protein BG003_007239 [Podila horticola]
MPRCKLCKKYFRNKGSLKGHYYDNHDGRNERITRIKCPLEGCTATFETRSGFHYHCKRYAEAWEHQRQSAPSGRTRLSLDLARELEHFGCEPFDIELSHHREEKSDKPSDLFSTMDESEVQDDMLAQPPLHGRKASAESTLDDVDFVRARLAEFAESFTPTDNNTLDKYFASLWKRSPTSRSSSSQSELATPLDVRSRSHPPSSIPVDDHVQDREPPCLDYMLRQFHGHLGVPSDPELEAIYRILFQDGLD